MTRGTLTDGILFLTRNAWSCRKIAVARPSIFESTDGNLPMIIRSIVPDDIDQFEKLHQKLRPGKPFSKWRRWLYSQAGSKLVWIAQTTTGEFVGFNMYYFREGEWQKRIVHEAFIGILEEFRGRGLSNALRSTAAEHFNSAGLRGISTQIDRANAASLRSAQHLGFQEASLNRNGRLTLLLTLPLPPR